MFVCLCMRMHVGGWGDQKRALGPRELELQAIVIWPKCVLGTEFRSARAANSLNTFLSLFVNNNMNLISFKFHFNDYDEQTF